MTTDERDRRSETPTTGPVLSDFRSYLQSLNRSPATISAYVPSVERFLSSLKALGIDDPAHVTPEGIEAYQGSLTASYSPASVVAHMTGVRAFYKFLQRRGDVILRPTADVPLPKTPHRLPRNVMTKAEVEALLNAPDTSTDRGIMYRALLELTYSTGLRRAEVCSLTIHDVDTRAGEVRVRQGKGKKDRTVPLGNSVCIWVRAFRDIVRPGLVTKGGVPGQTTLFLSVKHGTPISVFTPIYILKTCAKKAGITRPVTFHGLRHACATHMVQNGADLMDVKGILGHELVSTTQRYVELTIEDLKEAHRRFHPREQAA